MKVSVLIPVYNGVKYLKHSIDSVLRQTQKDVELIIIDDASTEPVWTVLRVYSFDSRIKLSLNRINIGYIRTLNRCLSQAQGDFIARHDADDVSFPSRFEEQLKLFDPDVGFVGCWAESLDEKGRPAPHHYIDTHCKIGDEELVSLYPKAFCLTDPTVIYSRAAVDKVGYFDEFFRVGGDYNYNRRVQKYFRGRVCRQVLYFRQRRKDSNQRTLSKELKRFDVVKVGNERADKYPIIAEPGVGK